MPAKFFREPELLRQDDIRRVPGLRGWIRRDSPGTFSVWLDEHPGDEVPGRITATRDPDASALGADEVDSLLIRYDADLLP
jgi:hypothetical protein